MDLHLNTPGFAPIDPSAGGRVPSVMRSRAATLAACLITALPLAGCYQGFDDTVNNQGPTGNGTDLAAGPDLKVQDITLVADPESGDASLVLAIINEGEVDEALEKVVVAEAGAAKQDGPIEVRSGTATLVGGAAPAKVAISDLQVPAGSWADLSLQFRRAGTVTTQVAVVPAAGYYAGYGPAQESPSPKATDEAAIDPDATTPAATS